jgi:hypothetical protein
MEKLSLGSIDFQRYLTCAKCFLIIDNPFEIECCGTLFCYTCIQHAILNKEKETCEKCNKMANYRQNSFVKRLVNGMELDCNFGCGKKFNSNEIKTHMLSCELREYICNLCQKKTNEKGSSQSQSSPSVNLATYSDKEINIPDDKFTYPSRIKFSGKKIEFLKHLLFEHENEILKFNDNFLNFKFQSFEQFMHSVTENKKKTQFLSIIEEAKENSNGLQNFARRGQRLNDPPLRMDQSLRSFDNYSQNPSSYYAYSDEANHYDS